MCSSHDSRPPIAPADEPAPGRWVSVESADGSSFRAFRADAPQPTGVGMLVLPDYGGPGRFYTELGLRCAEAGLDSLVLDYYGRSAAPPPREPNTFDHLDHAHRTTWRELQADALGAAAYLRRRQGANTLFSVGFCFGGRESFLLGADDGLDMAGVIGFYGWPVGPFLNDMPAPADVVDRLRAPVLAIFGGADEKISRTDVESFRTKLATATIESRVLTYAGAPHSFFDRTHERHREAADEAWTEVRDFVEAHAR